MRRFAFVTCLGVAIFGAFASGSIKAESPSEIPKEACELSSDGLDRLPVIADLGEKKIDEAGIHHIWFSKDEGDLRDDVLYDRRRDNLNFDGLYRVTSAAGRWYFRFEGQAFIKESSRTGFYQVEWAGSVFPKLPGSYRIEALENPNPLPSGPELSTVGDSITWWNDGRYLRCMMTDAGLHYTYVGSRVDVFGLHHEGEGGNSTDDVIARVPQILPSQNYLLIVGANDLFKTERTIRNIDYLAATLAAKKPGAKVYVSTPLPRFDEYQASNEEISEALRKHQFSCAPQCKLLDLAKQIKTEVPEWRSLLNADNLHPSVQGYRVITRILADQLSANHASN